MTTTTDLGLRIQRALVDVRVARLARGPNGQALTPERLAALVNEANDKLNAVLDEVHRN